MNFWGDRPRSARGLGLSGFTMGAAGMAVALLGMLFAAAPTGAQAVPLAAPIEIEGPITAVDLENRTISVMGVVVDVPLMTPITSPTAVLSFDDLLGTPFAGRSAPGFMGGTAIVTGSRSGGVITADDVFVEVAENVLLGEVTKNTVPAGGTLNDGEFEILGVPIRPVNDPRLPLVTVVLGLQLDLAKVPVGSLAGAEGHYAADGTLYAHTIEGDQADLTANPPETSIFNARCSDGGSIEVRGATTAQTGTITVKDASNFGIVFGTTTITPDVGLGMYRFRRELKGTSLQCPAQVLAENSDGSFAVADVGR